MTNDRRRWETEDWGGIEIVSPSQGPRASSAGNGQSGNGLEGAIVTGADKAASDRAGEAEPAAGDRSHVPPGVLEAMRNQVADFADFAHRTRIAAPNSADALQALGNGGGITAAVVEHMAAELLKKAPASLEADQRTLTDSLLLSLVAPEEPDKLTERQRQSFVSWRGRLALDVSMAPIEDEPITTVVRLGDHPERALTAGNGQVIKASDPHLTTAFAAVIVGSAAYIAEDRPYLSLDRLMTYARAKVYRSGSSDGPPSTHAAGLQVARNLEIVVLLDRWLDGGLWIDVDRANGRAAAALAIGLPPPHFRFTHIPELRVPRLRTLPEDIATA